MNRETTCCFTGHRPEKLPWREDEGDPRCLELKARLAGAVEAAYEKGMRHFLCGMARGASSAQRFCGRGRRWGLWGGHPYKRF